jgi:hypothetical protein
MASPFPTAIRALVLGVLLSLLTIAITAAPAQRQPVLVELFTSEGCSDCPPADDLLARLDQQQFVAGAQAIVLSEHVTYWNHQGWSDPFSSVLMDRRQLQYARVFALDTVYTPQIVVNGTEQIIGSDSAKLQSALTREAAKPKVDLKIESARVGARGAVSFSVHLPPDTKGMLIAAVAQSATVSRVSRGENAGRTLHHVAVVRALQEYNANAVAAGQMLTVPGPAQSNGERSSEPLRLIVFLVDSGNGKVMGAAEQTLHP